MFVERVFITRRVVMKLSKLICGILLVGFLSTSCAMLMRRSEQPVVQPNEQVSEAMLMR